MDGKKCFVIMPFSKTTEKHDEEYWTTFFETIKEVMDELGYDCNRSEVGPYKLFTNIISNINNSNIVVAVLTDFNPNVWYELGIRHTLKTGTIMLLQEGQKPPFDIGDYGIIFYKDSIRPDKFIKKEIKKYLDKFNDATCDSPVIHFLDNKTVKNDLEKRLEEMELLLRKIIEELPKGNHVKSAGGIRQNRVLWVDDYPSNNELVINFLENKNISVDIAISTKQGVDLFKKNLYDVIITDMGRGSESDAGITFIKKLKDLNCKTPIIVCASYNAIRTFGDYALSLGAYSVAYNISNFISALSEILEL